MFIILSCCFTGAVAGIGMATVYEFFEVLNSKGGSTAYPWGIFQQRLMKPARILGVAGAVLGMFCAIA